MLGHLSNWHPIWYRFGVIAAYCSNFGHFAFLSHPLGGGGLGTTYNVYLGLTGKRVVDILLVLIAVIFPMCYGWVATNEEIENRRFRSNAVTLIKKIQVEGVAHHQPFFSQKTNLNDLSYGIKQFTRLTDRRTDGRTDGQLSDRYTALSAYAMHSMQRGNKP